MLESDSDKAYPVPVQHQRAIFDDHILVRKANPKIEFDKKKS